MGDKDEPEDPQGIQEERNNVLGLQSEIARKTEQLARLKKKRGDLEEELKQRKSDLQQEQNKQKQLEMSKDKGRTQGTNSAQRQQMDAENAEMKKKVIELLQDRIPAMQPQGEHEEGDAGGKDEKGRADAAMPEPMHQVVLISHMTMCDGKLEDLKATFRLAETTTVDELHQDACEYWGCSLQDHALYKLDLTAAKDSAEAPVKELPLLQSKKIKDYLAIREKSQLFLAKKGDTGGLKPKKNEEVARVPDEEEGAQKVLKHTLRASAEPTHDKFLEAFLGWPGMHNLLLNRSRKHTQRRWKRTSMSEIVMYSFLTILSLISFSLHNPGEPFLMKQSIHKTLGQLPPDPDRKVERIFTDLVLVTEWTDWLQKTIPSQLAYSSSALNQQFTPVGHLRIRQQKAGATACPQAQDNIPEVLQAPCYYIQVDSATQRTDQLSLKPTWYASGSSGPNLTTVLTTPDPRTWSPAAGSTLPIAGMMQPLYDGSGYNLIVQMPNTSSPSKWISEWKTLTSNIVSQWLGVDTRFVAVELTLANYNLGQHVAVTFVAEISPAGGITTQFLAYIFEMRPSSASGSATGVDAIRWIIVILYILIVRVVTETKRKISEYWNPTTGTSSQSGLYYIFSFNGLLDVLVASIFIGVQYMWNRPAPPLPQDVQTFQSYSAYAESRSNAILGEGLLVLVLFTRLTTFLRILPQVYLFFKMFARSLYAFLYLCLLVVPVFVGAVFWSNTIWSPYVYGFRTWTACFSSLVLAFKTALDVQELYFFNWAWTIPFAIYWWLVVLQFFMNMFVAVCAHSYFEVDITERSNPKDTSWTWDQRLDWALWAPIYRKITGRTPGSSLKIGAVGEDEEEEEDDDDDE